MSVRETNPAGTRERLIAAAAQTLRQQGASGLTLDAVARQAGVSKGGLLHHFPSKDALYEAMLNHFFSDFDRRAAAYYEREPETPGRWLRAYIRATFDTPEDDAFPPEHGIAILLSILGEARLASLLVDDSALWTERLHSDGLPKSRTQIIRSAADGYLLERLIGAAPTNPEELAALRDELIALTEVSQ